MKSLVWALVFGGLLVTTALVAEEKGAVPATQPIVNKFCAVQGEGHPVDPDCFIVVNGKRIGFCCADCIAEFKEDPEKYLKKMK